jgi:hypothetical protein
MKSWTARPFGARLFAHIRFVPAVRHFLFKLQRLIAEMARHRAYSFVSPLKLGIV